MYNFIDKHCSYARSHNIHHTDADIDFGSQVLPFNVVIFGQCDPCDNSSLFAIGETNNVFQVSVKDDNDLEFNHGFFAEVLGGSVGVILPTPLQINITDDGNYKRISHSQKVILAFIK